jgi:hypothetical protein
MINKLFIYILVLITLLFTVTPVAFADPSTSSNTKGLGCGGGFGPIAEFLCGMTKGPTAASANSEKVGGAVNTVISSLIGFLTILSGLWFLFQFIIAGYQWISSGGDKHNVQAAREKITNAILGLVIVISAWIIVGLLGKLMGLDILNPGSVLINLIVKP